MRTDNNPGFGRVEWKVFRVIDGGFVVIADHDWITDRPYIRRFHLESETVGFLFAGLRNRTNDIVLLRCI